jgi:hypothetical protein
MGEEKKGGGARDCARAAFKFNSDVDRTAAVYLFIEEGSTYRIYFSGAEEIPSPINRHVDGFLSRRLFAVRPILTALATEVA